MHSTGKFTQFHMILERLRWFRGEACAPTSLGLVGLLQTFVQKTQRFSWSCGYRGLSTCKHRKWACLCKVRTIHLRRKKKKGKKTANKQTNKQTPPQKKNTTLPQRVSSWCPFKTNQMGGNGGYKPQNTRATRIANGRLCLKFGAPPKKKSPPPARNKEMATVSSWCPCNTTPMGGYQLQRPATRIAPTRPKSPQLTEEPQASRPRGLPSCAARA